MREAIRQILIAGVDAVNGRVFEPHAMTAEDELPALIVRETTVEQPGDYQASTTQIEVWPYVPQERFTDLDSIAEQVKEVLDEARLQEVTPAGDVVENGKQYYVEYARTGIDSLDERWHGITRAVVFDVTDLTWLDQSTFSPDPILALREWTDARYSAANVQTDPANWIPSSENPGIYWRIGGTPRIVEMWPTWTLLELRIIGHVLMASPSKRIEWIRRVHQDLSTTRRLTLEDGSPLAIQAAGADSEAHPIRAGQITLLVEMGALASKDAVVTVGQVYIG